MRNILTFASVLAVMVAGGCQERGKPAKEAAAPAPAQPAPAEPKAAESAMPTADAEGKVAVANAFCPMMEEHPVKGGRSPVELVRMWRGQALGFCCEDCPEGWDVLSDAEKDAAMAKVVKK